VIIPERYQPPSNTSASAGGNTQVATIYFTPQDENTSTTVLFVYNTGNDDALVRLRTYTSAGYGHLDETVAVPAGELVRICGDEVSTTSSAWDDAVVISFSNASAYGRLDLPAGVKAEGYVVWNGTLTYDPRAAVPVLPLRFSTDPATVFMPLVQRD
jgi:hypothetical protein